MLSTQDNELLCRVGPGTPMGAWFREYWHPVLRSPALEPGGDPKKVRVLGENYVAFRTKDGRIGMFDEACPHRGASLVLGRNDDCGLRCIYHGWAISVDGVVTETPNDPTLQHPERIPVRKVPLHEAGEIIWGWFGEGEAPAFPNYAFSCVPAGTHARASVGLYRCNWLQVLENILDPLHGPILHGPANKVAWEGHEGHPSAKMGSPIYESYNTPPLNPIPPTKIDFDATDYGFRFKVDHNYTGTNDGLWYPIVMPALAYAGGAGVGEGPDADKIAILHTPVDDGVTMMWIVAYNPAKPLGTVGASFVDTSINPDNWVPDDFVEANQWNQDRGAMAGRHSWSGLGLNYMPYGPFMEDVALCESMGTIIDRTKERLCAADVAIAQARRVYLAAVRAHMAGGLPLGRDVDVSRISLPGGPENEPVSKAPKVDAGAELAKAG